VGSNPTLSAKSIAANACVNLLLGMSAGVGSRYCTQSWSSKMTHSG
jgi:hypothetical protein